MLSAHIEKSTLYLSKYFRYFFSAVVTAILLCIFVLATCICQIIGLNGYSKIINPGFYLDPESSKVSFNFAKYKIEVNKI